MRLICPNCGAQYDVSDDVIPDGGRDVECSSCSHTWFQHDSKHVAGSETATSAAQAADPTPAGSDKSPERRPLDRSVADILRSEAEHEQAARQADTVDGAETQADTAPDNATSPESQRAAETRNRIARLKEEDLSPASVAAASTGAVAAASRQVMPNIDEINASLRARAELNASGMTVEEEVAAEKRRGFRLGFVFVILLIALLAAAYVFADQIVEKLPEATDIMTKYVAIVDEARLWVNEKVNMLVELAKQTLGSGEETAPTEN